MDFAAGVEVLADHGQQPFGDPVRAFGAEPGQGVPDVFVGEAFDQFLPVLIEVDAGQRLERGRGLAFHVVEQEAGEQRVLADLMGIPVTGQIAEVTQALVAGVEQAQFHEFIGLDVVHHLHAGVLEGRPALREVVLQDPLLEVFADYRPGVLEAEVLGHHVPVRIGGHRGDPVHH